ncbi:unnamed protein product [Penicillium bialowiezense]
MIQTILFSGSSAEPPFSSRSHYFKSRLPSPHNPELSDFSDFMMAQEPKDAQSTHSARDSSSSDRDRLYLERLGKKPVLKRTFGVWAVLGLSCTVLGTWEGLLGTFTTPLEKYGLTPCHTNLN